MVSSGVDQTSGRYGTQNYEVWVHYAYSVNGNAYQGKNVRFPNVNFYSSPAVAYKVVQKYRPGTPVDVFYDPNDPASSVLRPGAPSNWSNTTEILLLAGSLGAGLLILARYLNRSNLRTVEGSTNSIYLHS